MLNIRISHCTDGVVKAIEISDKDVALAFSPALENTKPTTAKSGRFIVYGNGTVTDTTTGLMWTRENVGNGEMKHDDAAQACKDCHLGGYADWRLPTRAELLTLVDDTRYEPAIDVSAFPNCKSGWYWTSTVAAWNSACAWIVNFSNGYANYNYRNNKAFVRAVRAAPASR